MKIKLAIFDVDGVVLDSLEAMVCCLNEALIRFRARPITAEWFQENCLKSFEDFIRTQGVEDRVSKADFDVVLDSLMMDSVHLYREYEGIRAVFRYIRNLGVPIHLVSACNAVLTEAKVRHHTGLVDLLEGIHGEEAKAGVFRQLMDERHLEPAEVIFVTDMPRDLHEAEAAGLTRNFVILSGYAHRDRFAEFGYPIAADHGELLALLREVMEETL